MNDSGEGYHFSKDEYNEFVQDMRAVYSKFEMISSDKTMTEVNCNSIRLTSKVVITGTFMESPANQKNLTVTGIFQIKVENYEVLTAKEKNVYLITY